MPLGLFLALAGILVLPALRGGHPKAHHRLAGTKPPHLRVAAEIADQNHLVHAASHLSLLASLMVCSSFVLVKKQLDWLRFAGQAAHPGPELGSRARSDMLSLSPPGGIDGRRFGRGGSHVVRCVAWPPSDRGRGRVPRGLGRPSVVASGRRGFQRHGFGNFGLVLLRQARRDVRAWPWLVLFQRNGVRLSSHKPLQAAALTIR